MINDAGKYEVNRRGKMVTGPRMKIGGLHEKYQRLEPIPAIQKPKTNGVLPHLRLMPPAMVGARHRWERPFWRRSAFRQVALQCGVSGEYGSMKSRETLVRLKKFQVDEKRRRVAQIENMIAEFDRMGVDLEREIKSEQDRAGIHDPNHFAYPTYAKAAMQRRENLKRSADELRAQLEDAKAALAETVEEMKKAELLDERGQIRDRQEEAAREPVALDAVGLMRNGARA